MCSHIEEAFGKLKFLALICIRQDLNNAQICQNQLGVIWVEWGGGGTCLKAFDNLSYLTQMVV